MGQRWFRFVAAGALLLSLSPDHAAQTGAPSAPAQPIGATAPRRDAPVALDPQFRQRRNQDDPLDARLERQRVKSWNQERFDNLKKDTDKLLKLATELKESVDKANKDTLSLEVIRKTEEVEKLAKSVREKMRAQL